MATIRRNLIALLCEGEFSDRELSQRLGIREKEVSEHLEHIRHSALARKMKLKVIPARCLQCGYSFESRRRLNKPGRCPRCKGEHVEDPRYHIGPA